MTNLQKLINKSGKILILSYDQGLEIGPDCLDSWSSDIINIFSLTNLGVFSGIALQKGIAEIYSSHIKTDKSNNSSGLILKTNGKSSLSKNSLIAPLNCSLDYALDLDSIAIGYTVFFGSDREDEMVREASTVQEYCREKSVPFILWSYPKLPNNQEMELHPRTIAYTARLGLELGADVVKLKYPNFESNVSITEQINILKDIINLANPIRVVFQGGKKVEEEKFFERVNIIREAGAAGMIVGRNVWASNDPEGVAMRLKQIWE